MNRRIWIGLLLLLGGCVPSLHPLYTEKDLTFDPALLGQWTEDDGKGTWAFTKAGEKEYRLVFTDNQGKGGGFQAHLLKIEGRLFLDIFPTDLDLKENDFFRLHLLPAHTFMLVKQVQPSLQMAFSIQIGWRNISRNIPSQSAMRRLTTATPYSPHSPRNCKPSSYSTRRSPSALRNV